MNKHIFCKRIINYYGNKQNKEHLQYINQIVIILVNIYTGWPKSHVTEEKIEYLHYGSSKRANIFTNNRGMLRL